MILFRQFDMFTINVQSYDCQRSDKGHSDEAMTAAFFGIFQACVEWFQMPQGCEQSDARNPP